MILAFWLYSTPFFCSLPWHPFLVSKTSCSLWKLFKSCRLRRIPVVLFISSRQLCIKLVAAAYSIVFYIPILSKYSEFWKNKDSWSFFFFLLSAVGKTLELDSDYFLQIYKLGTWNEMLKPSICLVSRRHLWVRLFRSKEVQSQMDSHALGYLWLLDVGSF